MGAGHVDGSWPRGWQLENRGSRFSPSQCPRRCWLLEFAGLLSGGHSWVTWGVLGMPLGYLDCFGDAPRVIWKGTW